MNNPTPFIETPVNDPKSTTVPNTRPVMPPVARKGERVTALVLKEKRIAYQEDQKIREILLELREYINNRIYWLLRDLHREELADVNKMEHIRVHTENLFNKIITTDMEGLRKHLLKMKETLEKNGYFSKKNNPEDRLFVTMLVQRILSGLGITGIVYSSSSQSRELKMRSK